MCCIITRISENSFYSYVYCKKIMVFLVTYIIHHVPNFSVEIHYLVILMDTCTLKTIT